MDDWYAFDDDYVRRLREDDPWTTRHFFHYFDRVLTIKMRMARLRPDQVDDGKQMVYVRVIDKVKKEEIRDGHAFGAFVSRVGDNVIKELLRLNGRTEPLDDKHLEIPSRRSADDLLIDHETKERVDRALAELTERDRDLLVQSLLQEDTTAELCARFGVDAEYLRVLLFRARQRFRSHYGADPPKKFPPGETKKP